MKGHILTLNGIFDAGRCMEYVRGIWENDRFFDNKSFAKTADYCAGVMKDAKLVDIKKLPVTADGKTACGDWVLPRAWDVGSAFLHCVGEDWVLADYLANPCSLVMYSAPTPPEGIVAECILADDLEGLHPEEARGKLLFTGRPATDLVDFAVKSGAVGIVTDYMRLYPGIRNSREDVYDTSMWANTFATPTNETGLFAFSLSPRNGDKLRQRLVAGESIKLSAYVNTRFYDGEAYVVSGLIPGETDKEICFYGHLYEPGAHDNASGCAAILELARCINDAIAGGIMPRPKLGLRFIMGPECTGSVAYFAAHRERKSAGCLVLDMVGTEDIDNTKLSIWHNPLANMSFIDALIIAAIEEYAANYSAFDWESRRFSIGTDNIIGDPCFETPTVAMIAEPALSYHSSLDTPDRIEPDVIKRNGIIAGACALTLAFDEKADGRACRVYKRVPLGPLTFDNRPDLKEKWNPAWNTRLNTPLFWMDGKRTLWEVAALAASELGVEDVRAYFLELCDYTDFLCENGFVGL